MNELLETLRGWQAEGVAVGRAVVVRTFGSAPRPEGAVLLATADGRLAGSVSGGCVEGAAYEEIERARRDGVARVIRYGISDEQAWDVGLACGGTIDVLVEPRDPSGGGDRRDGGARRRDGPRTGDRHPASGRRARAGLRPARPRGGGAGPGIARRGRRRGPARQPRRPDPRRAAGRRPVARRSPAASRRRSSWASASTSSRPTRSGPGSWSWAPSRSRSRWWRWPASSASRRSSWTGERPSPPRRGSRTWTGSSSAGRTRSPRRSGWARPTRSPSSPTT